MPSTSGERSFTLVWDSNFGSGCSSEMTATRPSRTSSPESAGSFGLKSLFDLPYWLIARVSAERKPARCVPPSGLVIVLVKQRIWSVIESLYWKTMSTLIGRGTSLTMTASSFTREMRTGFGMHDLLVLAELLDEFLDAVLVKIALGFRAFRRARR